MEIGTTIKLLRKKKNVKQKDLCIDLGLNRSHWSLIENNHRKPTYTILEKFCNYLGIPVAILFWFSLDEDNVPEQKKEVYKLLKPTMDDLIYEIFNSKI